MKEVLAIVVGGGPAPGINGAISAATIEAINNGLSVIGVKGGFKSLFEGKKNNIVPLTIEDVSRIHTQGGSILGSSREYPDKVKERFKVLMRTFKTFKVRYLITIGGDGTSFMARWIEREAKGSISVVHVPKTIDNDLPLPGGMPTFGYETARHYGVEIIKNLMEDAKTMGRWYFITTMGRNVGHLALGIGKASGATITLIPEEFQEDRISIKKIADLLEGSIIKRLSMGKGHGVAIIAEGIADKLDFHELSKYEHLERDETGRVRLSQIQLGRIAKEFVRKSLKERNIEITIVDKNIGYELRAADPIPFDIEYTKNLGYGAVKFLLRGGSGAMITIYEGRLNSVPFADMFDPGTGRTKIRTVDITSEPYEVGRKYMIRLEKEDFNPSNLRRLARVANMTPSEFRERFSYLFNVRNCK
ncbi:MAG: diphosphate--fructose-6-phosphate 1-phosphotransferase [Thermodesulfovibrionales bacterium]